jgi:hypothetical protein
MSRRYKKKKRKRQEKRRGDEKEEEGERTQKRGEVEPGTGSQGRAMSRRYEKRKS